MTGHESAASDEVPWQRLSVRVVWVDIAVTLVSLSPSAIAIWVFGVTPSLQALWPLALVAAFGVIGGVGDILRWAFTHYRVTDTDIERRTGVFVRRHRTLRRERVRSVDTSAKLRHRLARLRVVTVGAGQQAGAGESALVLDALCVADAAALRRRLLRRTRTAAPASTSIPPADEQATTDAADHEAISPDEIESVDVLATFRLWWVVYNMFSIWAYLTAAGLLWATYWLLAAFGIDGLGFVTRFAESQALNWVAVTALALIGGGLVGIIGMGVNYLVGYGRFELARVRTDDASYLRTRRGVLSTREVNRDESRMRGISLSEPLLWRWIGMADTNVITTGLGLWDSAQPTAILPRGPVSVARRVIARIYEGENPLAAPLRAHPPAALRRRLWWATCLGAIAPLVLAVPAALGAVPAWLPWAALGGWPLALIGAVFAARALGHTIVGDHAVVRSGMMSRTTSALRRDAVSTIAVRQSILQRRLGLSTVSLMTAAGWSVYEAPDLASDEAVEFADAAAPGLLDGILVRDAAPATRTREE